VSDKIKTVVLNDLERGTKKEVNLREAFIQWCKEYDYIICSAS